MIVYHATLRKNADKIELDKKIEKTNDDNANYKKSAGTLATGHGCVYVTDNSALAFAFALNSMQYKNTNYSEHVIIYKCNIYNDELEPDLDEQKYESNMLPENDEPQLTYCVRRDLYFGKDVVEKASIEIEGYRNGLELSENPNFDEWLEPKWVSI